MPETPIYYLSRNRNDEALKSLRWLRGWARDSSAVRDEFDELQKSKINAQICYKCEKQHEICNHPLPTLGDKVRELLRRRTVRPFIMIATLYMVSVFAGITPFRPYLVPILNYYKSPIDANKIVAYLGYLGFISNFVLVCSVRSLGKRKIYLWSLAIVVATLFGLGEIFQTFI